MRLCLIFYNFEGTVREESLKHILYGKNLPIGIESSEPIRKFVIDNQKCFFEDLFKIWDEQKIFY